MHKQFTLFLWLKQKTWIHRICMHSFLYSYGLNRKIRIQNKLFCSLLLITCKMISGKCWDIVLCWDICLMINTHHKFSDTASLPSPWGMSRWNQPPDPYSSHHAYRALLHIHLFPSVSSKYNNIEFTSLYYDRKKCNFNF